jgi:autotransporter translocation and assembly factor TamB
VSAQLRRKIMKIAAYAMAGLVALLILVVLGAVVFVQGERLAGIVNGVLPAMQGKIEFKSIRWKPRLLYDLVADRPTPMAIEGLRITDPEGTTVLDVPKLEVSVRLRPLLSGGGIILSDLHVGPDSVWRFAKMAKLKGIGFLAAFDPKNPPPPAPPKTSDAKEETPFVFQIVNANLEGFRAIFDFPGVWGLDLRDIHAPASLLVDGKGFVGWDVVGLEARKGGYLMVMDQVLPFDSVLVNRVATTRQWSDDIFLDLAMARTGRSELVGKGFFTGIYGANSVGGIKIHAAFAHAADALMAVAKPYKIEGLKLSGDDASVVGDLWDPYDTLKIKAGIHNLDAAYGDYEAKQIALDAGITFATTAPTMTIKVDELSLGSPSGGRFSTRLTMAGDDVTGKLGFDHFGTAGYLPAGLRRLAAGKVNGHIGVAANIGDKKSIKVSGLDLRYDRAFKQAGVPSTVRITGQAQASSAGASTSGLHVAVPGATAELKGKVELTKKLVDVGLRVGVSDLPGMLAAMKVGPLAKSAQLTVDVNGSTDRPNATGRIEIDDIGGGATGIPPVDKLRSAFQLRNGTLTVESLQAGIAGGTIDGSGSAKLFERSIEHMLKAPVLSFRLDGRRLSLADLVAGGLVSGQVSFSLTASGTTKRPRVHFQVPAGTSVEVLGQTWLLEGIDIEADKQSLLVRLCHVAGKDGGDIRVEGRVDQAKKPLAIDWRVTIDKLPIAAALAAAQVDVPASGFLSLDLHVTGDVKSPAIDGSIELTDVNAFDLRLGNAKLTFAPQPGGRVAVDGGLFGLLDLHASAGLEPGGLRASASASFEHVHAETFLPNLREQGIATSLSGKVDLNLRPGQLPQIDATLTEIDASITRPVEREDGTTTNERIWIKNGTPLHLATDTEKVVVDKAQLLTPAGDFVLAAETHPLKDGAGTTTDRTLKADMAGKIDLDLLQPFLAGKLTTLRGGIGLSLHLAGSVAKPDVKGQIAILRPVHVQARDFDQSILIPSGRIRLTSASVDLDDLAVTVGDASLKLAGKVGLAPGFVPTTATVKAEGEIAASLLQSIAPDAVSDVSGKASVAAHIDGPLDNPNIFARVSLGQIQMRLRGISRQVTVESGVIELTSHELLLRDVRVLFDEEGELLIGAGGVRPGRIHFRSLRPTFAWDSISLPLRGNRLGYRDGGVEIDDLSLAMELAGTPTDGLSLTGDVRLVSGRYLQDFNVRNLVISPRINESSQEPIWAGQPLLRDLALGLRVRTEGDGFVVQNNLAPEIHVVIDLGIGGTLSQPTISGEIRPTDGRFHIIGLRGDFELTPNVNHVTFVPTKSISLGDTPELNLEATNNMLDATGTEHTVLMKISGPINQATIDLSTTDGLDRNQTMLLLLSGRTTDDLSGNSGQVFGMNRQSGLDVLGQVSRDAVSNLVEPYIDDTLQMLTGRKWNLRPTIGADGVEVKVQAQATREFNLELSYLRGFQNQERYRAQGLAWIHDYLTARLIGERLTYSLQQNVPFDTKTFQLELTVEYPLRLPNPWFFSVANP